MRRILLILLFLPAFVHAQTIHIVAYADTICSGSLATFVASSTGITGPHYQWMVNDSNVGSDAIMYTSNSLKNNDTIVCLLTSVTGDTVFATSNEIIVSVQHKAVVGPITGPDSVCVGSKIILSDATPGGVWSATNRNAKDSMGTVTGVYTDQFEFSIIITKDTILYSVSNTCGTDTAFKIIAINAKPTAYFYLNSELCVNEIESTVDGNGVFEKFISTTGIIGIELTDIYGKSPGTDYVYNIVANSCGTDSFGQSFSVYPDPAIVSLSTIARELCPGDTTSLISSYSGSSPSWKITNSNSTISGSVFKAGSPGISSITLSVFNSCGFASKTTTVNILPPWPISGPGVLCVGGSIILSDSTTGGLWSSANTAAATIDGSGNVVSQAADSVMISYTVGNCLVKKNLEITPLPSAITGPDSICNGATAIALSHSTAGGKWTSSDTTIALIGSGTGLVSARRAGIDTVSYDLSKGCIVKTALTIMPAPDNIVSPPLICMNVVTGLTDTSGGYGKWSSANSAIAQIDPKTGNLTGVGVGYATISYTRSNGCFDTAVVAITDCRKHVSIFPNPATNTAIIEADTSLYFAYAFTNTLGQQLPRQPITGALTEVNIAALPKGIYLIIVFGYDDNYTLKFLKE